MSNATPLPEGWFDTFDGAAEAAKQSGKLVMVKVHADWCGYCKNFDREVDTSPLLSTYVNENFVGARIKEGTDEGKKLKKTYKIVAYPAFLIFRNGEFVGKVRGYRSVTEFLDAVKALLLK
ncbi:MAG: thioredoxin family protein [Cyanobacteria bacterium SZAS-4]|nr:thioredoxin family protein [Cyanobacteria bacterium SZAS-4]